MPEVGEFQPGQLVRYYFEGWRTGYFEESDGNIGVIRPMAPSGKTMRIRRIPLSDIEPL